MDVAESRKREPIRCVKCSHARITIPVTRIYSRIKGPRLDLHYLEWNKVNIKCIKKLWDVPPEFPQPGENESFDKIVNGVKTFCQPFRLAERVRYCPEFTSGTIDDYWDEENQCWITY